MMAGQIGYWLLDICTFNTCFLSLRTVRGARRNKHHKGDMNMSTTILNEWTGYGLANGEHLDYSKTIAGALHGLDPAKVPVGEQVAALEALNTKYTDFINESRKFVDTADITKADAKRDALFMAMFSKSPPEICNGSSIA